MRVVGFSSAPLKMFLVDKAANAGHPADKPDVRSRSAANVSRLRVVRESDSAVGPDCAGRMVISGRMADVCAELERMAMRGTAIH